MSKWDRAGSVITKQVLLMNILGLGFSFTIWTFGFVYLKEGGGKNQWSHGLMCWLPFLWIIVWLVYGGRTWVMKSAMKWSQWSLWSVACWLDWWTLWISWFRWKLAYAGIVQRYILEDHAWRRIDISSWLFQIRIS